MKNKLIKENTYFINPEKFETTYDDYFGFSNLTNINNNFLKTLFVKGFFIHQSQIDFGITYERKSISFIYNFLKYICDEFNKKELFLENKKINFKLIPGDIRKEDFLNFFKLTNLDTNISYLTRKNIKNLINQKLIKLIDEKKEDLICMINNCILGNSYLVKENISVKNEEDFPFFNYELIVKFKSYNSLEIEYEIIYDNPYNFEFINSYIEAKHKSLTILNNVLKDDITPSDFRKYRKICYFERFFNEIDLVKTFKIPKSLNKNKIFNDENPVFKIIDNDEYEGNINSETFLNLSKFFKESELKKFVNSLEKI
jgi:hypothetical protein